MGAEGGFGRSSAGPLAREAMRVALAAGRYEVSNKDFEAD
jgi:hypothetical protein